MKKLITSALLFSPLFVFAQEITNINGVTAKLTNLGNTITVLLISFAVIWIVISVIRYIISEGEARTARGKDVLWGIVGLFVIVSIWGLVAILKNTFSTQNRVPTEQFPRVIPPPGL